MRAQLSLESKLDAYEATSGEERPAGKGRRRNWRLYAAAAGSGLALTTSAEAGIIYSGPLDVTAAAGPNSANQWIANVAGANFIGKVNRATFVPNSYFQYPHHKGTALLSGGGSWLKNGSGRLANLASGAKISNGAGSFGKDGSQGVLHSHSQSVFKYQNAGSFQKGQVGFAGIKIGSHYGWMELKWDGTGSNLPNDLPTSITLLGWAYDTVAGQAIDAGQTFAPSTVPEPSTGLMALLATGSIGVAAWVRRRRMQRAATA